MVLEKELKSQLGGRCAGLLDSLATLCVMGQDPDSMSGISLPFSDHNRFCGKDYTPTSCMGILWKVHIYKWMEVSVCIFSPE